ncbi:MAG: 4Fe-4S binding protein [Bacillota bacterium]|jgi:formate hydrogenlyase subunit 6/NADH:ubiquinone oxidoreductase subunit I
MKFGVMIKEVLPHLTKTPNTILYPFQRVPVPKAFRGKPVLDTELCRGCAKCACEMICPAEACKKISIGDEIDRLAFWYDRCIYCGECAERCPFNAVTMTQEFELGAYNTESLYAHPEEPQSEEALALIEKARERKRLKAQKAAEAKKAAEEKKDAPPAEEKE